MSTFGDGGMFGNIGDWWDDYGNSAMNAAGTAASIYGALDNAKETRAIGQATQDYMTNMGKDLKNQAAFKGYGVSTGLGNSTVSADGSVNLGVGPEQYLQDMARQQMGGASGYLNQAGNIGHGQSMTDFNRMAQQQLGMGNGVNPNQGWSNDYAQNAAYRSMADPSARQGQLYSQMMNAQRPELDRMSAQQNAQEYAMGRGGVTGSQFGGTAEDAAMARARAQASNQATLNAFQQADNERKMYGDMSAQYGQLGNQNFSNMTSQQGQLLQNAAQLGQLGNTAYSNATQHGSMLGGLGQTLGQLGANNYEQSYMPMDMQLKALGEGYKNADMSQTALLQGLDYQSQLALGGMNANMNAQHSANELTGSLYNSLLGNLGGTSGSDGSSGSGLLGAIGGGIDAITGLFGG